MKRIRWVLLLVILGWGCASTEPPSVTDHRPLFEEITKIDVHSHIFDISEPLIEMMRESNLKIINICTRGNDLEMLQLCEELAEQIFDRYPEQFNFASTFDVTGFESDAYAEEVQEWLARSFDEGAVMTKIWKEVGMEFKKGDGTFLMPDDPVFDPIYEFLAARNKPLIAHLAEPIAAWLPLDPENVHYGYYSNHPEWHFYGRDDVPGYEEIIQARDRVLEKHPDLTFIGAHLGSMAHDVDEVAERLDRFPQLYVEVAARTRDLTRQPAEKVREFFVKYQDRILYGVDLSLRPDQLESEADVREFVREMEERYRRDFQYYAGSGTVEVHGKEVECLELPVDVLEKFYHGNARRIIPDLSL